MTLFYVSLEAYPERYTDQLSTEDGWFMRACRKAGVPVERVTPEREYAHKHQVKHGSVLDIGARTRWAFAQVEELVEMILTKKITASDTIYFDDLWHPGIEQVRYAWDQVNGPHLRPKMYAYCWAQSVDKFDFTHPMRNWMRHFERGIADMLDGIFVASTLLKELLQDVAPVRAGLSDKVHVVGLPFDFDQVTKDHEEPFSPECREKRVLFTSRLDPEKNPLFFLRVADKVWESGHPDVEFAYCTSAGELRSRNRSIPGVIEGAVKADNRLKAYTGLTKASYYQLLRQSEVQFNCADQDWVSFTLLEAASFGCVPVYPSFRSFPETFCKMPHLLYNHKDEYAACKAVCRALERLPTEHERTIVYQGVVRTHTHTIGRILWVMGYRNPGATALSRVVPYAPPHTFHQDLL